MTKSERPNEDSEKNRETSDSLPPPPLRLDPSTEKFLMEVNPTWKEFENMVRLRTRSRRELSPLDQPEDIPSEPFPPTQQKGSPE